MLPVQEVITTKFLIANKRKNGKTKRATKGAGGTQWGFKAKKNRSAHPCLRCSSKAIIPWPYPFHNEQDGPYIC